MSVLALVCGGRLNLENVFPEMLSDFFVQIFPQRTDENQSMVRKAAVFCIVRLYVLLGEERVRPKFSLLNSSKIR